MKSIEMDLKSVKNMFAEAAKDSGFDFDHGGWFRESPQCIMVLGLQKSHYGNYFELNIKLFVQGLFGQTYSRSRDLVSRLPGDVFFRAPDRFRQILDVETPIDAEKRALEFRALFEEFLIPVTSKAMTRRGIVSLEGEGLVHLLPAVQQQLAQSE